MALRTAQTVVIGCGTGRCGTESLSKLIGGCQQAFCTHERRPLLPWVYSEDKLQARVRQLRHSEAAVVGDVAYYYLPYLERLIELLPTLKVICLERERQQVIDSFMWKTEGWNRWSEHDGSRWAHDPYWDITYPKYPIAHKPDAIGAYWDEYHEAIGRLAHDYPEHIRIMGTDAINARAGQDAIFDFLELPQARRSYPDHCRHNARDCQPRFDRDGEAQAWMRQLERATQRLATLLPPDAACILVDQETLGERLLGSRRHIPFLERGGKYNGLPAHAEAAIEALERLRQGGAEFIVFAWPAFWWLAFYPAFHHHLQTTYRHLLTSKDVIVFDLRCEFGCGEDETREAHSICHQTCSTIE